jgi:hypothetical protein
MSGLQYAECMRVVLMMALAAAIASGQFAEFATPGDGSKLYFSSSLPLQASNEKAQGRIFSVDATGVQTVADVPSALNPGFGYSTFCRRGDANGQVRGRTLRATSRDRFEWTKRGLCSVRFSNGPAHHSPLQRCSIYGHRPVFSGGASVSIGGLTNPTLASAAAVLGFPGSGALVIHKDWSAPAFPSALWSRTSPMACRRR